MLTSKKSSNLRITILASIVIFLMGSCYSKMEGCLDPDSTNYDVTADEECSDCCEYPTLSVLIAHRFGDEAYSSVDTVSNNLGGMFVIEDAQTYVSEISLAIGSSKYSIDETISYTDQDGNSQEISDDIALVTPSGFRYELGSFSRTNIYDGINLTIGVPKEIDDAQSFSIEDTHPLAIAGDSLYLSDQNKFVKSRILIRQIGIHNIVDTLHITEPTWSYAIGNVSIEQQRGESVAINLKVDYQELIADIDYNTMSKSEIETQIGINLIAAIVPNF